MQDRYICMHEKQKTEFAGVLLRKSTRRQAYLLVNSSRWTSALGVCAIGVGEGLSTMPRGVTSNLSWS